MSAEYDPFRPEGALDASGKQSDVGHGEMVESEGGGSQRSGRAQSGEAASNPLGSRQTSKQSSAADLGGAGVGVSGHSSAANMGGAGSSQRRDTMGRQQRGGSLEGDDVSGTQRRGTGVMGASMRAPVGGAAGNGALRKKPTLASLMLSGSAMQEAAGDDDDPEVVVGGPDPDALDAAAWGEEGGEEGEGFATADRMEAEQIFMPNMKREAYIPVRIARDKVKMVLSEMAQLKSMHYQALETMEKQHEFLKAQLEASVATYVKKLTKDYNDRVRALEAEYKRRLAGLSNEAMSDLQHTIDKSKNEAAGAEEHANRRVQEKVAEFESERKLFMVQLDEKKRLAATAQQEAAQAKASLAAAKAEIDDLKARLLAGGGGGGGDGGDQLFEAHQRIQELEAENVAIRSELQAWQEANAENDGA